MEQGRLYRIVLLIPGSTIDWGYFRPDFDCHCLLATRRYRTREKEEEREEKEKTWRSGAALLRHPNPSSPSLTAHRTHVASTLSTTSPHPHGEKP
ncbi:hypothetical protein BHM03_00006979 [Ensete ventricosum]|nr:hypothetical protein BHM03_00006979 [Ensete ventricosum]